jgi:hypothetical protein
VAIVFKDLQRLVSQQQKENTSKKLFQRLQGKPFWIWDKHQHKLEDIKTDGDCCFNHIIGLPTKEGEEKAMFDYEKILYDCILEPSEEYHRSYYNEMLSTVYSMMLDKESTSYKDIFDAFRLGLSSIISEILVSMIDDSKNESTSCIRFVAK